MKECPFCKYVGIMECIDGYIIECPNCKKDWNEDDYDCDVEEKMSETNKENTPIEKTVEKPTSEKKYKLVRYVHVEDDRPELMTAEKAKSELKHAEFTQPDNKYEIVEVETKDIPINICITETRTTFRNVTKVGKVSFIYNQVTYETEYTSNLREEEYTNIYEKEIIVDKIKEIPDEKWETIENDIKDELMNYNCK